jgi:acetolactate synthase-1/2/3 large subunit
MRLMNELALAAPALLAETPDAAPRNAAQRLLDTLIEGGVEVVFGYPGGAVLPIYDALHGEPRLHHVLVRHEQAAVHAAQGYARVTGKVGVVIATSGPGMSNTTTGLLDAMCDSIPVLCICGQVPRALIGTQAFQECDALGISRPVTKWNARVEQPEDTVALVRKALATAAGGRPGSRRPGPAAGHRGEAPLDVLHDRRAARSRHPHPQCPSSHLLRRRRPHQFRRSGVRSLHAHRP